MYQICLGILLKVNPISPSPPAVLPPRLMLAAPLIPQVTDPDTVGTEEIPYSVGCIFFLSYHVICGFVALNTLSGVLIANASEEVLRISILRFAEQSASLNQFRSLNKVMPTRSPTLILIGSGSHSLSDPNLSTLEQGGEAVPASMAEKTNHEEIRKCVCK